MRLFAISDLHVRPAQNRRWVEALGAGEIAPGVTADDWLILGGDLGESESDLAFVLDRLAGRFARLAWVPGNHELWTMDKDGEGLRGVAKYERLVAICRERGVLTPEDPYERLPLEGPPLVLAPLFVLYDYSFRPDDVPAEEARAWAAEAGIVCTDEYVLHPDPYPTREAWCAARIATTEARLVAIPEDASTILVNHFPLLRAHAVLPRVPRFSIWCGTRKTEDWHRRFRARAVVFGHLHIRQKRLVDGVWFHEVSLGYPRQWDPDDGGRYLRQIWPPEAREVVVQPTAHR